MAELQVFIAWLLVHRSKHCSFVHEHGPKLFLSFLWSVSGKSMRMECPQAVRYKRFAEAESGWYRWRAFQGYGTDYLGDSEGSRTSRAHELSEAICESRAKNFFEKCVWIGSARAYHIQLLDHGEYMIWSTSCYCSRN